MIPTIFGVLIGAAAFVLLLWARVPAMFSLVLGCALMSGSAAAYIPGLGLSSIPPAQFALGFLVLRLFLPGSGQRPLVAEAMRANTLLLIFVCYGVLMAFVGPRLFAGAIDVVPMRITEAYIYATDPLHPSAQNITTSVYLTGTLLAAVSAYVVARNPGGPATIVRTAIVIAWIHIWLGVSSVAFKGTAYSTFLEFFRNGHYAQVDQRIGSLVRMNGIMTEPSIYAGFGLGWFIFLFECWYRGVLPRRTGPVALALGMTLLASTSTTAYVGLAGYAATLLARTLFVPIGIDSGKIIRIVLALLGIVTLMSAVLILHPALATEFGDMLVSVTIDKRDSTSGLQRAFWARLGIDAFRASSGLGIGPGSFRSSSLFTAIAGATGVVGSVTFAGYLIQVLKPLRASSYGGRTDPATAIGVAASWAAFCLLIPAAATAPGPDPGTDFALFAGIALALRRATVRVADAQATARAAARRIPAAPTLAAPGGPRG